MTLFVSYWLPSDVRISSVVSWSSTREYVSMGRVARAVCIKLVVDLVLDWLYDHASSYVYLNYYVGKTWKIVPEWPCGWTILVFSRHLISVCTA